MKKYAVLALLMVLGTVCATAPSFDVSYEVTPSSINPGGSGQVIVTIENDETLTDMEDVEVELKSKDSAITVTAGKSELETISASSTSSAAFTIRVKSSASPGSYIVEARGTYEYGTGETSSFRLNIPVTVAYRSGLEIFATDTQVTPGGSENLLITIQNSGASAVRDLILTLSPSTTYVYPTGNVRTSVESINAGDASEAAFRIRASDSAVVGIQPVTLTVTYTDAGGGTQTDTQSIGVTVVDAGTEIIVDGIESDLEPGKSGRVSIGLRNVGEANLENIYASITTTEDLNIRGSNEKLLDSLVVGETKYLEFDFEVSQDAESIPAESTLSITYQHEGGKKEFTDSKPLGIVIMGDVELRVIDVDVDREDGEMEVDIANYGNKDAEAVKIVLLQDGEGIGTGFTDSIKPNKHKVFRFDLPTKTNLVARISYKDYEAEAGESFVEENILLDKEDISMPAPDMTGVVILLIVVAAVIVWYMRKRSGDKQKIDVSKYK